MNEERTQQIMRLAEGNPGALTVLIETVQLFGEAALDQVEKIEGLRGPEIWILYKDENGQKIGPFFAAVLQKAGFGNG